MKNKKNLPKHLGKYMKNDWVKFSNKRFFPNGNRKRQNCLGKKINGFEKIPQ